MRPARHLGMPGSSDFSNKAPCPTAVGGLWSAVRDASFSFRLRLLG
jgi:hypothetical protein